ncbi:MAG: lysine--tRNA ligase [Blastocatellia bacterium]|nr:lysine--tRNA ligase [Blastocatellia bacterium]
MSVPEFNEIVESNDQTEARRYHLESLRELVGNVYPNKFDRGVIQDGITIISNQKATITNVVEFARPIKDKHISDLPEGEKPLDEQRDAANAELNGYHVRIAGRLAVPPRVMGKAAFVHLSDGVSRLQIYARKEDFTVLKNTGDSRLSTLDSWTAFGLFDHGDFIGVEGFLFVTKTGELSVHVETIRFLAKAMFPMPDKMHGIADPELQRRFRYADLIASSLQVEHDGLTTREVFERRAKLISGMRRFLDDAGYNEVETPMLTPKATGAAAKPFATHHNALDIPLYARVAPELYLKRLTVGGFEKVYELNRNFRNEGLSMKHNPEFTMLEFYCAYMDVNGMMDFSEAMIKESVQKATGGSLQVKYGENEIDFSKFERISMMDAVEKYALEGRNPHGNEGASSSSEKDQNDTLPTGRVSALFEEYVESKLIQPTFIIDYPKSISPLSKASPENPNIAERFELFINGMECANGFSELNDPQEQYERFVDQMKEREGGDEEAMVMDEDYIRALSYGMPPAAGIGIGIDRLVMLLTNRHSIRDVILFPHMRPERREDEK